MINKDRIRAQLAKLSSRGQPSAYWSPPKEGKATIRMFPVPNSQDPILDYFFHFGLGRQSILCPVKNGLGSQCPVCKLADQMWNSSNSQDKEIGKRLFARQRFYATVVDRSDDTLTAKYWGFSMGLYTQFLGWLADEHGDYCDFLDHDKGLDLVVSTEKVPGKMFAAAKAEPKRRESALAANKAELEAIIKSVKPASEIFIPQTAEEIQQRVDEWLATEGQNQAGSDEPAPSREVVKAGPKPSRDVGTLFDQMEQQL